MKLVYSIQTGLKNNMINFIYGMVIGSSMLIPGISGGTTAIIIGIYDRLIIAVSGLIKKPKQNIPFLLTVLSGGAAGALLFSGAALKIMSVFPTASMFFFIGAIIGSIPLLIKRSGIGKKNLYNALFALTGTSAAVILFFMPDSASQRDSGPIMLMLSGMIIATALVLPGISTSHILLVLGMYESVLSSIRSGDISYLAFIAAGAFAGIIITVKITEKALNRFPCQTYMIIIGFVISSVYDLIPRSINNGYIPVYILLCAAGAILTFTVSFSSCRADHQ